MLSREENELLSRVGPDAPLGQMFRRYWIPACLSEEIAEPGSPPVRVRLLGEDLIAFRDTGGRVGLVAENCSHRLASLFYGRNEEGGLRCIYHGWKYDVEGNILETPCEQEQSMLRFGLHHRAYPCEDINGIVWTYMGPSEKKPLLPDTLWFTGPSTHVETLKFRNESSYLQGIEGECDHLHTAFLHRRGEGLKAPIDPAPIYEIEQTSWGIRAVTYRRDTPDTRHTQMNLWMFPFVGCIGGFGGAGQHRSFAQQQRTIHAIYHVPADDFNETRYEILVDLDKPATGEYRKRYVHELTADHRKVANHANDYLIDRELQRASNFAGIPFGNHTQDAAMTETTLGGPIADRTQEHLGGSDEHIVAMRQRLLAAVKAFQAGEEPPGVALTPEQNDYSDLYCTSGPLPAGVSWRELLKA
jgi:phthalate 4,5-dioxygenase